MGHRCTPDTRTPGCYSGPRPRLWRSTSSSPRSDSSSSASRSRAGPFRRTRGPRGKLRGLHKPGSEGFHAASGGRRRSLKDPSPNTYRRRGRRGEGPGYASPRRRAQTETGHAVYSMVSSPLASQKPSARLGQPRRVTALRGPDSVRAAGRWPAATTSGSRWASARYAGRAAQRLESPCCLAPPGVEEAPLQHYRKLASEPE